MDVQLRDIGEISKKLYPFAFCLIPDELMATQVIIDAFHRWGLEQTSEEELEFLDISIKNKNDLILMAHHIYELATIRSKHFAFRPSQSFYKLPLVERAVLFLKDIEGYSFADIAKVISLTHDKCVSSLYNARANLLAHNSSNHSRSRTI